MNRACARRLLAVPVLLWAALSASPAVADSCAYATIDAGDGRTVLEAFAAAGGGADGDGRGGGHHHDGHGGGHGGGHHCPPPP
ncbi:hypothetical protein AB4039_23145, partial [Streptomyces sp. M-16]|uniref:hypothetical protein n=1 Tax=Streptomyces sp. M-16 TaxID=3233040 RepID=UPI003F98FCD2